MEKLFIPRPENVYVYMSTKISPWVNSEIWNSGVAPSGVDLSRFYGGANAKSVRYGEWHNSSTVIATFTVYFVKMTRRSFLYFFDSLVYKNI